MSTRPCCGVAFQRPRGDAFLLSMVILVTWVELSASLRISGGEQQLENAKLQQPNPAGNLRLWGEEQLETARLRRPKQAGGQKKQAGGRPKQAGGRPKQAGGQKKQAGGQKGHWCKQRKSHSRIIGGRLVHSPNDFPFLAWIGDNDGTGMAQFCSGTLITDRVVMTAGHCLNDMEPLNNRMYVRFRLTNYATTRGIARDVVNWVRHPQFRHRLLINDIALLLLNKSVTNIKPVNLSNGQTDFETSETALNGTILGWGSLDEQCMQHDPRLRIAEIPRGTAGETCTAEGSKTLSRTFDYFAASQLCAGKYIGDLKYPGCGDSGSPMLTRDGDGWVQVGMVSWSYGVPWPDVFTRVSYFRSWVFEQAEELLRKGPRR